MPSSNSPTSAPMLRRFRTTSAIRSDSFTRSSPASRIVTPVAVYGATAASTGNSSINCADREPRISAPLGSAEPFACTVPINSPCFSSRFSTCSFSPMLTSTSSRALRDGFSPRSSSTNCESGKSRAAHRKNAAELRSPGTVVSIACSIWPPRMRTPSPSRSSSAPNARRACSEWLRVRTLSFSSVCPFACRPANSTAVFT